MMSHSKIDTNEFLDLVTIKEMEYSGFVDVMVMEMTEKMKDLKGERKVKAMNLVKVLRFYRHNYAELMRIIGALKAENAELRKLI